MWKEIFTTFITLFVIVDPIGAIPVFVSVTSQYSSDAKKQIAKKAVLVAGGVLCFFILLGQVLFDALGVRLLSFEIAGGIVLFLFGLKMIFDKPEGSGMSAEPDHDVAVFPLAFPTLAGPGAMLGVVVAANRPQGETSRQVITILILLLVLFLAYILIRFSGRIHTYIGNTGAIILSRVLGIILTAIATETVLKALAKLSIGTF